MRKIFLLLIAFLTSSCLHRAPSLKMLEELADYAGQEKEMAASLHLGQDQALRDSAVPVRTAAKTAHIWIVPHETAGKEYFWGGWISVVVEGDRWESSPEKLPEKPAASAVTSQKK